LRCSEEDEVAAAASVCPANGVPDAVVRDEPEVVAPAWALPAAASAQNAVRSGRTRRACRAWRNAAPIAVVPSFERDRRTTGRSKNAAPDDERRELEYEADLLETELRHLRARIDQLRQDTGSGS